MNTVAVRILHVESDPRSGPLVRLLAAARRDLADRHATRFAAGGADDVAVVAGPPDATPFGARLRELVARSRPDGLVVLGSGAVPLATPADAATFVAAARLERPRAVANNRYSADIVAVPCAGRLADVPDLPADNALPRWLDEVAGYEVVDLRRRWRLSVDLDSPLDLVLVGGRHATQLDASVVRERLAGVAATAADRRAELVVAGRTSAAAVGWLERHTAARVRAIVEERGLRAGAPQAQREAAQQAQRDASAQGEPNRPGASPRPPRSLLGVSLDREGPDALGPILAGLGDAALVDTRVLLAHRLGADERTWPSAEDRYASDLLHDEAIADPWLRALTRSARHAHIPVVLGGHTLVGPGVRLVMRARPG